MPATHSKKNIQGHGVGITTYTTHDRPAPWAAMTLHKTASCADQHDKESEEHRLHESSSQGMSDDDSFAYSETVSDVPPPISRLSTSSLSNVLSYLPLEGLTHCHSVSHQFNDAANAIAATPFRGATFLRYHKDSLPRSARDTQQPRPVRWQCATCEASNAALTLNCRNCGGESTGVRRLFVGQLRKDRTAELLDWILRMVYPDLRPVHIESHTKDGRGKGCAWIYVSNARDEERLLALNKRIFVDVDAQRREGIWYVGNENIDKLTALAEEHAFKPHRPLVLPRQPLVCERPQGGAEKTRHPRNSSMTSSSTTRTPHRQNQKQELAPTRPSREAPVTLRRWTHNPYAAQVLPLRYRTIE